MSLNYGRGRVGGDDYKFSDRRREHRDCRSPEALERRREQRSFYEPPRPPIVSVASPTPPPPRVDDGLLHDAELLLDTGARVRSDTFTDEVRLRLKVSFDVAAAVVRELVLQGRLVRTVADNGFATLSRPTGKAAHQKRSK
jgi:hypothetical protein